MAANENNASLPGAFGARVSNALWELRVPMSAILVALAAFGVFVTLAGAPPLEVFQQMLRGSFGTWFSFQNSLQRAAPLMLTALATALPARLGLVVIGAEGAVVMGGLGAATMALSVQNHSPLAIKTVMVVAGAVVGAAWIGLAGALKAYRGVNETISSLLLSYVAIALLNHFVEGSLRDPESLNKPSTLPIGDDNMLGSVPGLDVHMGLAFGLIACLLMYVLMQWTVFGFSCRVAGGNSRAAQLAGLPVKGLILVTSLLGGGAAGMAGAVEVAAVHGCANASLVAGYGYTGILVSFIARHNPLAIVPVSVMLGGLGASSGLLQRSFKLPDATVNVLQGLLFIAILFGETYRGRERKKSKSRVKVTSNEPAVA